MTALLRPAFFILCALALCGPAATQAQPMPAIEMADIPAGSFLMGACVPASADKQRRARDEFMGRPPAQPACQPEEEAFGSASSPQHAVRVRAFQLGKTAVTLGQFKAWLLAAGRDDLLTEEFMQANRHGDQAPVVYVSWHDAQDYIRWLNQTWPQGGRWRLPSEAEWEYACRAGQPVRYCGSDAPGAVAWHADNSGRRIHPVAQKQPNAWGLYDMSGNAFEWVQDCWHNSYKEDGMEDAAPADGSAWESSCSFRNRYFSGLRMVQRGGSALAPAFGYARALVRHHAPPKWRGDDRGFRLARDPHP